MTDTTLVKRLEAQLSANWDRPVLIEVLRETINAVRAHASAQPAEAVEGETRAILQWIMRAAESAKEECGMDPESPVAIRNGKMASIANAAAQALGIIRGPSYCTPDAAQGAVDLPTLPKPTAFLVCKGSEVICRAWNVDELRSYARGAIAMHGGPEPCVLTELRQWMEHCVSAADEGVDYACPREVLDALTTFGLMEKCGRGKWRPTDAGEKLASRTHPHPTPDTTAAELLDVLVERFKDAHIAEFERLEPITRPDYAGRMQANMDTATRVALLSVIDELRTLAGKIKESGT